MSEGMSAGGSAGASTGVSTGTTSTATSPSPASSTPAPSAQSQPSQSSGGGSWDGNQPSGQTGAQPQAQSPAERLLADTEMDAMITTKVNGREEKITVREAIKRAQLASASNEKMQRAAAIEKRAQQMEQLLKLAEENPGEFFKARGKNFDSLAEEALARKFEEMQMTPEQRELRDTKAERDKYKSDIEKENQSKTEQRSQQIRAHVEQSMDKEIGDAFKESGLPKHPLYVAQLSYEMLRASKTNQPLTAKEAAAKVKSRWEAQSRSILESMDAEAIRTFLGPKVQQLLTDHELKRVTDRSASEFSNPESRPDSSSASGKGNQKQLNQMEWRKAMGLS